MAMIDLGKIKVEGCTWSNTSCNATELRDIEHQSVNDHLELTDKSEEIL